MSFGLILIYLALAVTVVLTVLSIVVSTSKGAGWGQRHWDGGSEVHDRHARHQRDHLIRSSGSASPPAVPRASPPDPRP